MVKILCIGDPHVQVENIKEVNLLIGKLTDLAISEKPDFIVVLGDVLHNHERLHTIALNKAYEMINCLRKLAPTYVLVGNHDMCFGRNIYIKKYDETIIATQDVKEGMILMGDDRTPRKVLRTWSGYSQMYNISQESNGKTSYTVTPGHRLCFFHHSHKLMFIIENVSVEVFWIDPANFSVCKKLFIGSDFSSFEECKNDGKKFLKKYEDIIQIPASIAYRLMNDQDSEFLPVYRKKDKIIVGTKIEITRLDEMYKFHGIEVDGNHRFLLADKTIVHNCNNQQFLSENHWMNAMKEWSNVTIVDKVISHMIDGKKFVFCPYVPAGKFIDALDTVGKSEWKDADIIFCHQEFKGCKLGALISEEGDDWGEENPFVISGHIHSNQKPQKNIYYSGSAMQNAFGESESNVIPIVTLLKDSIPNIIEHDLELPRKYMYYLDIEDFESYVLPSNLNGKIKISLTGNYNEFKSLKQTKHYKDIISKGVKIVFKPKINKEYNQEKTSDSSEIKVLNFNQILRDSVLTKGNQYLEKAYDFVVVKNLK